MAKFNNPEHVKAALRSLLPHYKNVWSELARKLGITPSRLSGIMHDRYPVTQEFLDLVREKTARLIPMTPPVETTGRKKAVEQVLAVVAAMDKLDSEAEELLDQLVNFRTGGKTIGTRGFIQAVQDINIIKGMLRDEG